MGGESAISAQEAASFGRVAPPMRAKVQIYASTANADFAENLALALHSEGFEIATGAFETSGAACVVVVWSGTSIASSRLIEAARAPLARGALVPVSIGKVEPPEGFQALQSVDLAGWSGDAGDPRWRFVIDEIRKSSPPGADARTQKSAVENSFDSWFDKPYTDDSAPPRPAPAAAPSVDAAPAPRRVSPVLLSGFGALGAAIIIGFAALSGADDRRAAKSPASIAASVPPPPAPSPIIARIETAPPAAGAPAAFLSPGDGAGLRAGPPPPEAALRAPEIADPIAALIAQNTAPSSAESAGADSAGAAPVGELAVPPADAAQASPGASDWIKDCGDCPELARIPAGSFTMGSGPSEGLAKPAEGPAATVTITRSFALARTETSVEEWNRCVAAGACPALPEMGWGRGRLPAVNLSWLDAQSYARWLSGKTGKRYRLPSEAEWEYAARAGAETPFSFGPTLSAGQASFDASLPFRGKAGAIARRPRAVASFAANAFGLYDMHGNVWEWTEDCWAPSHDDAAADGAARGGKCAARVLKGGAWNTGGWRLRAAHRISKSAAAREYDNGFRVVRDLP